MSFLDASQPSPFGLTFPSDPSFILLDFHPSPVFFAPLSGHPAGVLPTGLWHHRSAPRLTTVTGLFSRLGNTHSFPTRPVLLPPLRFFFFRARLDLFSLRKRPHLPSFRFRHLCSIECDSGFFFVPPALPLRYFFSMDPRLVFPSL